MELGVFTSAGIGNVLNNDILIDPLVFQFVYHSRMHRQKLNFRSKFETKNLNKHSTLEGHITSKEAREIQAKKLYLL